MYDTPVILVKVVGEEDNNGYQTEFFRVAKKYKNLLLIPPTVDSTIVLSKGKFFINEIVHHISHQVVYLFEYTWYDEHRFWGDKNDFDKIEQKYVRDGWSTNGGHQSLKRFLKGGEIK